MIELNGKQLKELKEHFIKCYPNEGVCFVVDNELMFLDNIHPTPQTNFRVDKADYIKVINTVQAVIHSHPSNKASKLDPRTPSPSDVNNQIKMDIPWGIVSIDKDNMSDILWYPSNLDDELYGRSFIHGVYDCFEFVRSYYWQKYKISINKPLGHNWSNVENSFINDQITDYPIEEVSIDDIQIDDLVTFRRGTNNISHLGVYVGGDRLAHHALYNLSRIERMKKYKPFIYKVYRLCHK